jgi:glutathione S-transferase
MIGSRRVDEAIAWFESNFYRDFGYQYVYPQLLPQHRRANAAADDATVEWGRTQSQRWFAVLDGHFLRRRQPFVLGEPLTIADFFGASITSLGELVRCRFDGYPNVARWLQAVGALEGWRRANAGFRQLVEMLSGREFVPLQAPSHARAA